MINASFSSTGRDATISGAYQYDTGQRLKMHGLPSPSELAERDDFLSGDVVTVQAQFGFTGDSQTEASIAEWVEDEEGNGYWLAKVPDVYMLKNQDVHVYVYVSYGQTETSMRSKTVYEAVFRPISRPAPSTNVTPDQTNDWDRLVVEVNAAIGQANNAAGLANGATATATDAANAANAAAAKAASDVDAYLQKLDDTQVSLEIIGLSETPTVEVEDVAGADNKTHKKVTFRLPQSVVTVNEQAADENGNITLTPEHVGAMPATHQTVFEFASEIPTTGWKTNSTFPYCEVTLDGVTANDAPVVDVRKYALNASSAAEIKRVLDEWANVVAIDIYDGRYRVEATKIPSVPIPIKLLCVR